MNTKTIWGILCLLTITIGACKIHEKDLSQEYLISVTDTLEMRPLSSDSVAVEGIVLGLLATDHFAVFPLDRGPAPFYAQSLTADKESFYFGHQGRGPGEFIHFDAKSLRHIEKDVFGLYDSGRFMQIALRSQRADITAENLAHTRPDMPSNGFKPYGDGFVDLNIAHPDNNKELVLYDTSGEISGYMGDYPNWDASSEMDKRFLYIKNIASSPDAQSLALFYGHFYAARFYRNPETEPLTVRPQLSSSQSDAMQRKCYVGIPYATNTSVWALCMTEDGAELHEWSWTGKLRHRYILSSPVSFFSIAPSGKTLIGYNPDTQRLFQAAIHA